MKTTIYLKEIRINRMTILIQIYLEVIFKEEVQKEV
jgi:hypothetical protein